MSKIGGIKFGLNLHGIGDILAQRILDKFGEETVTRLLKENPYKFMDVDGISFYRADAMAKSAGILDDQDDRRRTALIKHTLDSNTTFGHTYLPEKKLQKEMKKHGVTSWKDLLADMQKAGEIVLEYEGDVRIYLTKYWEAEVSVAALIKARASALIDALGSAYVSTDDENEDVDQKEALQSFGDFNTCIITGGPGTGKTYVTNTICKMLTDLDLSFALCAPTGKAAKRLSELTGHPAKTIHRLLGANPISAQWKYNKDNPLTKYDWIICDETSMIDIVLAYRLLSALKLSTRIIFIGDVDQLAPVGPGSFFRDVIRSGKIKTFRFQTNHRQGKGSMIAENALRINRGELMLTFGEDLHAVEADNPIIVRDKIMELIRELRKEYPNHYADIQVLSPQKKTLIGVEELNNLLRFELNPLAKVSEKFSVGDKIMQTKNDYRLELFNGFLGKILQIKSDCYVIEFFGEKTIDYPKSLAKNLMLAYCCTVHKFQGSEVKAGIVIISSTHTYMLTRNLLYTAMTRFKEQCIILCDRVGLKRAIQNNKEKQRFSRLLERLMENA